MTGPAAATSRDASSGTGPSSALQGAIGSLPYRLQMAGGWIDQPFVSSLNPEPPGSMVVVSLLPTVRYMDRCGMATGTRTAAQALWGDAFPVGRTAASLVRELYAVENANLAEPSGSQDMCGLIYPGSAGSTTTRPSTAAGSRRTWSPRRTPRWWRGWSG